MSLTKNVKIDQITISENGIILYRELTQVLEDDKELSRTYYRSSLTPGQDLTNVPNEVVSVCNLIWTSEVIAAYQAQQNKEF